MILRLVSWSVFLCLALRSTVNAEVQITENGYENVLISFSRNVPSENGQELIKNITELLENASKALHTAIGVGIKSATFLLPPSWSTEKLEGLEISPATLEQAASKPDINVDATAESPFGKQPVALQHGGCGVPGHQIILPQDFLSSTPNYPKDKLLAREWLKHRYGVFEENGFKHDDLYPDYYKIPGSSDIRITQCTDKEVTYKFKRPADGEECTLMDAVEFNYCRPHPDEEMAANITSSLMYFHQDLPNMENICGKDGHPHHNTTLSKQNILCNGKSIWDVVQSSNDFKNIEEESTDKVLEPVQFSYIQSSQPRFIILLEDSDHLFEMKSSIAFALGRFYYDLRPKSKLAIYTFTDEATPIEEPLPYGELTEERSGIGPIADFITITSKICTSCGVVKATETFLQNEESRKSSIFLITASSLDKVPELHENLKASGISLNVLRFVGSEEPNPVDATYEDLKDSFSSFSYVQISNTTEKFESFKTLFNVLKEHVPELNDFTTKTVVSDTISVDKSVTIPEGAMASLYTLWLGAAVTSATSIKCKAGDADVTLTAGVKGTDIASFTFSPLESEVICSLGSARLQTVLIQVQMTTKKGYYFDFDTWIHDESTDNEQKPIILYAKVYFGGYPVKEATVTASIIAIAEDKPEEEVTNTSNNPEEITVKMFDNGRGDPDITRNDGVYSGYFTGFESAGRYQIIIKMSDNEGKAKIGKEYTELMSDTCCGSKVFSVDGDVPAFEMEKVTEYTAKNKMPEGGYSPSRIVDLRVELFNNSNFALLTWTAPGGGKASSYEFYAFCDFEDCEGGRLPYWLKLNQTELKPKPYGEPEEMVVLFIPDRSTFENLTLFFAIKSLGEKGKSSDLSNKAEIFLSFSVEPPTTIPPITDDGRKLSPSDKTGIIVGSTVVCVFLLICIGALLYCFVVKPRRAKLSNIDTNGHFQDENLNNSEISGSFRALPIRDRGSMRRVESFPVILYTHDQLKDFKKKVDPPLYKPAIAPRPWMSMHVLSNRELNRDSDSKSIGSSSTLPMNDKHRSTEMKQLDDVSIASDTPHPEVTIKF